MKDIAYLLAFAGALVAFHTIGFARGYFLWFAPFSLLTPLVLIGLAIFASVMAIVLLRFIIAGKATAYRRTVILSISVGVVLIASFIPSTDDAFRYRMGQMSEEKWLELAGHARSMAKSSGPSHSWHRDVVGSLARSYSLLAIGESLPKLFVSDRATSFYWGSGLVGTLGVEVLEPSAPQPLSVGYYRYSQLYPRVILVVE